MTTFVNTLAAMSLVLSSLPAQALVKVEAQFDFSGMTIQGPNGSEALLNVESSHLYAASTTDWNENWSWGGGYGEVTIPNRSIKTYASRDVMGAEILSDDASTYAQTRALLDATTRGEFYITLPYRIEFSRDHVDLSADVDFAVQVDGLPPQSWTFEFDAGALSTVRSGALTYRFSGAPDSLLAFSMSTAVVPEPETYALLGMGLAGLVAARRRARFSAEA